MIAVTTSSGSCPYCALGSHRVERCPEIREIHYRKDGTVSHIVKMSNADRLPAQQLPYWWSPSYTSSTTTPRGCVSSTLG